MIKIFKVASLVGVLTFCVIQTCHCGDMLKNGGFEQGNFPPEEWSDWSGNEYEDPNNGVAGFPTPKELSRTGNKAVGKILYGTGKRWGGFSQTVEVSGGGRFNASGYVMNNKNDVALGRGAKVFLEVKFLSGDEEEIKKVKSANVTRPTDWKKLSANGLVPHNARQAVYSFVFTGEKSSRGKVIFDDAKLVIDR